MARIVNISLTVVLYYWYSRVPQHKHNFFHSKASSYISVLFLRQLIDRARLGSAFSAGKDQLIAVNRKGILAVHNII